MQRMNLGPSEARQADDDYRALAQRGRHVLRVGLGQDAPGGLAPLLASLRRLRG